MFDRHFRTYDGATRNGKIIFFDMIEDKQIVSRKHWVSKTSENDADERQISVLSFYGSKQDTQGGRQHYVIGGSVGPKGKGPRK